MSRRISTLIGLLIVFVAILACSMPLAAATPTPQGTLTTTITASSQTISQTATLPEPTNTPKPEATVTVQPSATTNVIACNWADFVSDVNYPDNTVVPAGSNYIKTWRLKNIGSCTWTSGYKLIFTSGDGMGGAGTVQLTNGTVTPGATVDVSINLTAPAAGGTYQGNYKLQSGDGTVFGIGPTADGIFYVKIVVESQNNGNDQDEPAIIPVLTRNLRLTNPMMTGNDVKMLQSRLLELGFAVVGTADGKFGPKTDNAVRLFQGSRGLTVDGIVGQKTWTALWE